MIIETRLDTMILCFDERIGRPITVVPRCSGTGSRRARQCMRGCSRRVLVGCQRDDMGEAGFPLQFGDGFAGLAGLEGLDAWKNRRLVANWIVRQQDTRNGGETQRQKRPAPSQG